MGELSQGSGISSIRGGDFELGSSGVSAAASSNIVVEDITPILLMPLEDGLELVLGASSATFTRSTTGTFDDKDDVLVKTASIDVARFESNGALIEGTSTNISLRSEDFSDATWIKNPNVIVTPNTAESPDGLVTADTLTDNGSGDDFFFQQVTIANDSNIYTASVYIKKTTSAPNFPSFFLVMVGGTSIISSVTINTNTGVISYPAGSNPDATIELMGDYWRVQKPITNNTTGNTTLQIRIYPAFNLTGGTAGRSNAATGSIIAWGAQAEQRPFASSYIPTTTVSVTKALDDFNVASGNIPAPTDDYTISMKLDVVGLDLTKTQTAYSVDGETSRKIEINTTTGLVEATHGAVTSISSTALTAGAEVKIAFVVNGANQTLYINGTQEDQDAKGTVTGTATAISIGNEAGSNQLFGHERNFRIYDTALTAEQVAAL